MRIIKKSLSIFILTIISIGIFGQTSALEKNLSEADFLYAHQQYEAAIKEYQRYLFMSGTEEIDILMKVAGGLYKMKKYDLALQYYEQIYYLTDNPLIKLRSRLEEINFYIDTKDYNKALVGLYSLEPELTHEHEDIIDFLFAICHYGLEEYETSEDYFLKISSGNAEASSMIREIFADEKRFYRPNPRTVSILSLIIPGLGQIISGEYKEGINSFILVEGIGVLAVYVGFNYSIIDAIFSVVPWYQRYLLGGSNKAEKMAIRKRSENRNEIFQEILLVLKPFEEDLILKE